MSIRSSAWCIRSGITAVVTFLAVASASPADATAITDVNFTDIGIGALKPGQPDTLIVTLSFGFGTQPYRADPSYQVGGGSVSFGTLDGYYDDPLKRNYVTGFTFTLSKPSAVKYQPGQAGQSYELVKGTPNETNPEHFSIGDDDTVTFGPALGAGKLSAGTYTLIFDGSVNFTQVGSSSLYDGTISAVPLPGSLVMFGSALLGLTAFGRRRRARPE